MHALQVEINRALYLDEERIERGAGFEQVCQRLTAALTQLVAVQPSLLTRTRPRQSFAAE